ncbi:MAG: zinc ribbon domain-containing protein [Lentimicrobiaceae bacterium]|nr:zinc ribbon domain-containing protein [Lentimicrobiaceae bacterium]
MIFCENCGNQLDVGQKFCDGCGTAAGVVSQPQPYAPPPSKSVPVYTTSIVAKQFRCGSCGETLDIPKNSRGVVKCPYCKNESVLDGIIKNAEIAAKENIIGGVPLMATPTRLHRQLVAFLSESPTVPLDIFEKVEVIREERYCVPSYQFNCSGTMNYSYQAGHPVEKQKREKRWGEWYIVTYTEIEWHRANDTAELDAEIFVSGNKTVALQVETLYTCFDPGQCEDIEYLTFPCDVATFDFDLPENKAFSDHVKPYMEDQLERRVRENIEDIDYYKDVNITGSKVRKEDLKRVFLGLYRIVFMYCGKEYSMWATGDGQEVLCDDLPIDQQREQSYYEKQNAASVSDKKTSLGWPIFWLVICGFCAFLGWGYVFEEGDASVLLLALPLTVGFIYSWVTISRRIKAEKFNEILAKDREDFESFDAQRSSVVQQFKAQKRALRGIYENVSGDAYAF